MVLDIATTTVAFGKVSIAKRGGKDLPAGWVVDAEGQPVTDAEVASEDRRLTPLGGTRTLGGHKGYGLALMVEVLASALVGAYFGGREPEGDKLGKTANVGHFFMAIDPAAALYFHGLPEPGALEAPAVWDSRRAVSRRPSGAAS